MRRIRMTRRRFAAGTAATTAAAIAAPYVHTTAASGSLTLGLWDHWVPGANDTCTKIINEWDEQGPPLRTSTHYPNRKGGDQQFSLAAAPAPAGIAAQIFYQATMPKMVLRHAQGESVDTTLDWAASELEGFSR
jgi:ABC-type glycerol-3-phosphate transport system substrate-binding protein